MHPRRRHACDTSLIDGDLVAVDIEATGCKPGIDAIIEIGAVRISRGRIVDTFGELVSSPAPIPYSIQLLTGISDAMVAGAPPIADVMRRFREFASEAVLVAHNYRFDLGFLDYESELLCGEPFPRPVLDTLSIARTLHPELAKHNLSSLAHEFDVPTKPTHRAVEDARAAAEVFLAMLPELLERGLRTAEDVSVFCGMPRQHELAAKLPLTTHLPASAGVYAFTDAGGRVLYVGRARNLRHRVRSYFYAVRGPSSVSAAMETARVDVLECRSDLDALLMESRLVARYHPPFQPTPQRGDITAFVHLDDRARFPTLKVVTKRPRHGMVMGPFTSVWALETLVEKVREVYGLRRCTGRLTRDSWQAECERRDMNACPKPCVGGVTEEEYAGRMQRTFSEFHDNDGEALRLELERRQQDAVAAQCYEEAIGFRDALRALDRIVATTRVIREAVQEPGVVLLSGDAEQVVLHFVSAGC